MRKPMPEAEFRQLQREIYSAHPFTWADVILIARNSVILKLGVASLIAGALAGLIWHFTR